MPKSEAVHFFQEKGDEYKLDLLQNLKDGEITFYTQGGFTDLCRGPHIPDTGFIKALKLTNIAGAYWKGDEKNKQLTRIYGVSFPTKKELDEYLLMLEEAKKRIHDNPGNYLPHIFGETEVGGTSVMLLSPVAFHQFGYRTDLTERALPMYTYQVLSRIPDFVPLFGVLLGGVYWITHRREDVAQAEAEDKQRKGGVQ